MPGALTTGLRSCGIRGTARVVRVPAAELDQDGRAADVQCSRRTATGEKGVDAVVPGLDLLAGPDDRHDPGVVQDDVDVSELLDARVVNGLVSFVSLRSARRTRCFRRPDRPPVPRGAARPRDRAIVGRRGLHRLPLARVDVESWKPPRKIDIEGEAVSDLEKRLAASRGTPRLHPAEPNPVVA